MSEACHLDFETRSVVDLKKAGAHRYFEHEHTELIMLCWRIGAHGRINRWRPGDEDPYDLLAWVEQGKRTVAHSAGFERGAWRSKAPPHWPPLRIENQDCTLARGVALGLPAGLDQLGTALKMPVTKDKEGHALMLRMCKPRRMEGDTPIWWDDEERIERLFDYCEGDVESETVIDAGIPQLSPEERKVWELDQHINDRGVMIDVAMVQRALDAVTEAVRRADERMWWLTDGEVKKCSEAAKIVTWLNARGIPCESVAKGEIEELVLKSSIMGDDTAEEVIRLRRAAARTSTTKFKAMLATVCADGRVRGSLAYHGAHTGRWAGRGMQPHNFLRFEEEDLPDILMILDFLSLDKHIKEVVDAIEAVIGPPLESLAKCMRSMLIAAPGMKFVSGDFANIEGRGAAWVADETWKLDAFRAFDRGEGHDLYNLSYARSFGLAVETMPKKSFMRQIGKVQELALGYQGSVGAFVTMAATYLIKPADVAAAAKRAVEPEHWFEVSEKYSDEESRGLDRETWTGIKIVVNAWRAAHPRIVQSWWDLQDAAIEAVGTPGLKVPVLGGKVIYLAANGFLYCRLPSGRVICYAMPRLVKSVTKKAQPGYTDERTGEWVEPTREQFRLKVEFDGVNSVTKRWCAQSLYGGMQFNHVVQGLARDKLVSSMFRLEEAGYPIVLTVHDENLSEVDALFGSAEEYRAIMEQPDDWCRDLPVVVKAWEGPRYVH